MVTVHSVVEWCVCVSLRCIRVCTCVLHTVCAMYVHVCYIQCVLYLCDCICIKWMVQTLCFDVCVCVFRCACVAHFIVTVTASTVWAVMCCSGTQETSEIVHYSAIVLLPLPPFPPPSLPLGPSPLVPLSPPPLSLPPFPQCSVAKTLCFSSHP